MTSPVKKYKFTVQNKFMKKIITLSLLYSFGAAVSAQSPFTPGNLVVYRVGDGAAALSAVSAAGFLEERTTGGTIVQTIPMPVTGTNQLSNAGSATTEGFITRSQNGSFLSVPGYNAPPGTAAIAGTTAATTNRVINVVDNTGNIISRLVSSTAFSAGNIRSAVADGASAPAANYWAVGSNTGVVYYGTGTPATVSTTSTNIRTTAIYNSQLYYSTGSGTTGIYTVGTGMPTTAGNTSTNVIATGTGASPYAFAINAAGTVCYIADDRASGGGILKYTFSAGVWSFAYAVTSTPVRGLAVDFSQSPAVLYATTTAASANNLISVTDNGAGSTTTTIATAGTNTAYRGVAFAPASGSSPVLSAAPGAFNNILTNAGTASATQTYQLNASNLSPAAGNIAVSITSNLEISTDGISFGAGPLNVPYTGGALSSYPLYFRVKSTAAQGVLAESITHSGGGATNAVVNVTGGVVQNYYNTKANNGLTNLSTWSTTTDGTGPSPADFVTPYQYFNIINQTNANYTGVWDVSNAGVTTKVIVGNGTNPLTFTVLPGADSVTSATRVDVLNNATLNIQNNKRPFLNNIATGSTIKFTQTGLTTADTIKVPALSYYNLVLKDGIKVLSGNTTTVRGDLTLDHAINFNGPQASPFATINLFGDFNLINGSTFEPLPSGDLGRITLSMNNNSGGPQNINGPGVDVLLYRLKRDTVTTDNDIILAPGTNITVGNSSATPGGLQLNQGAATTTTLTMTNSTLKFVGNAFSTTTSLGQLNTTNSNVVIEKATVSANAGTLRFTSNSTLNSFTVNFGAAFTRDSILVADNVKVNGTLNLTKGKIVMASTKALTMDAAATFTGGSAVSFVDGKVTRNTAAASAFVFPVGKAAAYRPATVTPADASASVYSAEYFAAPYSTLTFLAPLTGISNTEYWDISRTSGASATVSLSLNGTAVPGATASDEVGVAHFESGNWVTVSGTGITPGDATTGTAVSTSLSTFSPFTFGIKPGGITYTFNGNGNWSNSANWSGGLIPPANLVSPNKIIIDPTPGGQCIVDVVQQISAGAQFVINPNAKILLPANLIIQ